MVKSRTRIVVGTRETPRFVSKSFYDLMLNKTTLYQLDHKLCPNTIKYFIPSNHVVERKPIYKDNWRYEIDLDDTKKKPHCYRIKTTSKTIFKCLPKTNNPNKIITVVTEDYTTDYYLLIPNASYYNTEIVTLWDEKFVLYDNHIWSIHFKTIYVDPFDSEQCIWFTGTPKFQIEMTTETDLSQDKDYLYRAIMALLPRSHLWD